MKPGFYYVASIILLSIACCLHMLAREHFVAGQRLKAEAIEIAVKSNTQYVADPTAKRLSDGGKLFQKIGFAFMAFGVIFLVVALFMRKFWLRCSIPVFLLVLDILLVMLL